MTTLKILVADDHPIFRIGLCSVIKAGIIESEVREADNGVKAWDIIMSENVDVAILDINMPGIDGLEICKRIKNNNLNTKVIILTMYKEKSLLEKAKENGAKSYLIKDNSIFEVVDSIKAVLNNKFYWSESLKEIQNAIVESNKEINKIELILKELTSTELKILKLVCKNYTSKEIAELLFITSKSVDNNRSRISKKMGLDQVTNSLLIWAMQNKNTIDKI
ncbi:MAG: response regulator transcription factor [Burkholderiales bacterium]|nr:response regulator transcription factor [Bacteroidia bacterium]